MLFSSRDRLVWGVKVLMHCGSPAAHQNIDVAGRGDLNTIYKTTKLHFMASQTDWCEQQIIIANEILKSCIVQGGSRRREKGNTQKIDTGNLIGCYVFPTSSPRTPPC